MLAYSNKSHPLFVVVWLLRQLVVFGARWLSLRFSPPSQVLRGDITCCLLRYDEVPECTLLRALDLDPFYLCCHERFHRCRRKSPESTASGSARLWLDRAWTHQAQLWRQPLPTGSSSLRPGPRYGHINFAKVPIEQVEFLLGCAGPSEPLRYWP